MREIIINTQRVLSPTQISIADYVINPYRGCEFACAYCYARENKNIKFGNHLSLGVKLNAPEILRKELLCKRPKRVLLGSTTECFQRREKEYKITEKILLTLNRQKIPYTILTKSHLITGYLNLISPNPLNEIFYTLNIADESLINALEEKSSSLEKRLAAMDKIIKAGINLRAHIGPFIPYVSSLDDIISILPKKIEKINVELYHHKMGNFKRVLCLIEKKLGKSAAEKISSVYKDKKSYCVFAAALGEKIRLFKTKTGKRFFYLIPGFDTFYTKEADYETEI